MKLPRDVTGTRLAQALQTFGYRFLRQRGSHIHMVTDRYGEHHIVVPEHRPIKPVRWANCSGRSRNTTA